MSLRSRLLQKVMLYADLEGGWLRMDEFTHFFSRKDMTFEEAVAYFKERVPITASRFYQIAAEVPRPRLYGQRLHEGRRYSKVLRRAAGRAGGGNSLAEFRENMNDFLEAEGYEGITP